MKHAVEYALIHHDGKTTWKIKDLSIFLRQYDACVEALRTFVKWCDSNDWGTMPKRLEEKTKQALAHAEGAR